MATILIGVDDSDRSPAALAFGEQIAAYTRAEVVTACAYLYDERMMRTPSLSFRNALRGRALRTAREMSRLVERVPARGAVCGRSTAARALHDLAQAEHAALLVVGRTRAGRFGRVFPGSTAEHLVHEAPCPVAVVPPGYRARPIRRIGVADNGTPESRAGVEAATAMAEAVGARLTVIGAIDIDPAAALAERTHGLDMLVMGSRGFGPLRSVALGGVSGRVMRDAPCPVLVVPRGTA